MPQCKKCGKSYSIWTADLGAGVCQECKAAASAEELKDSFPCLIPDGPLSMLEQVGVGLMTMGLGRASFRDAQIKLRNGRLSLFAHDTFGTQVEIANVEPQPGAKVSLSPITVGSQLKIALGKTVVIGLGIGVLIAIGVVKQTGQMAALPFALAFGAVFGVIMAGLFTLLPAFFKADPGLCAAELPLKDGKVLVFALKPDQMNEGTRILTLTGLSVETKSGSTQGGGA